MLGTIVQVKIAFWPNRKNFFLVSCTIWRRTPFRPNCNNIVIHRCRSKKGTRAFKPNRDLILGRNLESSTSATSPHYVKCDQYASFYFSRPTHRAPYQTSSMKMTRNTDNGSVRFWRMYAWKIRDTPTEQVMPIEYEAMHILRMWRSRRTQHDRVTGQFASDSVVQPLIPSRVCGQML